MQKAIWFFLNFESLHSQIFFPWEAYYESPSGLQTYSLFYSQVLNRICE